MSNWTQKIHNPTEVTLQMQHNEVLGQFGLLNNRLDEQAATFHKMASFGLEEAERDHDTLYTEIQDTRTTLSKIIKTIEDSDTGAEIVAEARAEKTYIMLEEVGKTQQRDREQVKTLIAAVQDKTQVAINAVKECDTRCGHLENLNCVINANLLKVSADLSAVQVLVQKLCYLWFGSIIIIGGLYTWIKLLKG